MLACWIDCSAQFVRSFVGYVTIVAVLIDSLVIFALAGFIVMAR